MSRRAIIDTNTGFVENVIELEDDAIYALSDGKSLVDAVDSGGPGDTWDGAKFVVPLQVEDPDEVERVRLAGRVRTGSATLDDVRVYLTLRDHL